MGTTDRRQEVTWEWLALLALVVVAGAAQRITGLGFALVATPGALMVLGGDAVPYVALVGSLSALMSLGATWRRLQPRAILGITAATLVSMVPVLFVAQMMTDAASSIIAGALVVVATIVAGSRPAGPVRWALASPVSAGALTGLAAGLAGLAGPTAAAHGMLREWGDSFVPNLQVVLIATLPPILLGHGWPTAASPTMLVASVAAVAAGTLAGSAVRHRIRPPLALWGTRVLAVAGGIVAIVAGIGDL